MIGDPRDAGFLRDDSQDCQSIFGPERMRSHGTHYRDVGPSALGMDEADMSRFLTYRSSESIAPIPSPL
jgi:hypothetical protein